MQVDSEDRYVEERGSAGLPRLPIALAVLALIIGIAWYFSGGSPEQEEPPAELVTPVPAESPPLQPEAAPAPDIPEPVTVVTDPNDPNDLVIAEPELKLEESDPLVRETLAPALADSVFAQALRQDDLLERGTAFIDAAGKGSVLNKVLPIPRPEGNFAVRQEGGKTVIDPATYARYDGYAEAIGALDPDTLAAAFHQFRPLLEQAYGNLGYQQQDMDNSLIRALDQVIAAPVLDEPPALEQRVTTYTYADEALENLSPIAKQLLRMGPENQRIIQDQARALRAALLTE
ncbi:DUF3014 domain-containing protein [Seongchinamella unica]|uniref:DUF3014 domain-containing protein n=1 Tax=Seongchinamella unica TaxID=2547392 RepID=A0A4R5LUG9_9GAMM|nr:DUF3014 domain-containing protein [Seongchinamella unica]TDG14838.1 DUF3014 domain-containing protein [Seongchinamella unica]